MLNPTKDACNRAADLQRGSFSEGYESKTPADERAVAVATVHARQDIVLIYSMLTSCHDQSVRISRGVWALVAIGCLILVRMAP